MTVKVVQGLVGKAGPEAQVNKAVDASRQATQAVSAVANATTQAATNDAVITNIRASKSTANFLKIRDYEEAKEVAKEVAEEIRTDLQSLDTHSELSGISARGHFNN